MTNVFLVVVCWGKREKTMRMCLSCKCVMKANNQEHSSIPSLNIREVRRVMCYVIYLFEQVEVLAAVFS